MAVLSIAIAGPLSPSQGNQAHGRNTKKQPDVLNTYPIEVKVKEDGTKERIRRVCSCGSKLLYDIRTLDLYCQERFIVSE